MAGEIFISYRRSDQDKARLLHALLKQRGVDAWYDALVGAGEDWRHKTAQALGAAPIFVLLFSKVASESDDISKELAAATFSKKLVIPDLNAAPISAQRPHKGRAPPSPPKRGSTLRRFMRYWRCRGAANLVSHA